MQRCATKCRTPVRATARYALGVCDARSPGRVAERRVRRTSVPDAARCTINAARGAEPASAPRPVLRFAEFFAGIGLMRLGIERAVRRNAAACVYANDLDPRKRAMYLHHFRSPPGELDARNVRDVRGDDVPDIDLATASFPCTDLSLAGGRGGLRAGESSAFWAFTDVLSQMGDRKPPLVLLENVVGLLNSHNGRDMLDLCVAMNDLGYGVDPIVLDAKWFVPQSRPRLFIVCERLSAAPQGMLAPDQITPSHDRPDGVLAFMRANADGVRWAVRATPPPPLRASARLRDVLDVRMPNDDPSWWSDGRVAYLLDQMWPRQREALDRWRTHERARYATAFRRMRTWESGVKRSTAELRTDGIAGCLRTPKGGSARQIVVRAGYGRIDARLLSPRECARLMGAGVYRIEEGRSFSDALFGFGDAVCVPAVSWLIEHRVAPALQHASERPAQCRARSA